MLGRPSPRIRQLMDQLSLEDEWPQSALFGEAQYFIDLPNLWAVVESKGMADRPEFFVSLITILLDADPNFENWVVVVQEFDISTHWNEIKDAGAWALAGEYHRRMAELKELSSGGQ